MARRKSEHQQSQELIEDMVKTAPKRADEIPIEEMPLNTFTDYVSYNRRARAENKKLRVCRYPAKQCPIELHPHETVVFNRNDQPSNPLPVFLSNEYIHFDRTAQKDQLMPGKEYSLPRIVIEHLASRGTPIWAKVTKPDGSVDTAQTGFNPRFSFRTIYRAA